MLQVAWVDIKWQRLRMIEECLCEAPCNSPFIRPWWLRHLAAQLAVKPFIAVARNEKGKRFTVFQDGATEAGLPTGIRGKLWNVNNAKSIASWIIERGGHFYVG